MLLATARSVNLPNVVLVSLSFWDTMSCRPEEIHRRLGATNFLRLLGRIESPQQAISFSWRLVAFPFHSIHSSNSAIP
jgi:hypothetical protein